MKTKDIRLGKNRFAAKQDLHIRYLTRITGSSRDEIEKMIRAYGVSTDSIMSYLDNLRNRKSAS